MLLKILSNSRTHLFILGAVVCAAFANVFANQFLLDDINYIVDWAVIRNWPDVFRYFIHHSPAQGQEGLYSPIKIVLLALGYHMFGLSLIGYHILSLLIHFSGVICVYMIIRKITRESTAAFLSALVFAAHPVQIESVAFITGSIDTAGVVFLFISFLFFLKAFEQSFNQSFYIVSILFCILAVYTNELCLSLPLLISWYSICFLGDKLKGKAAALKIFPYFLIVGVYLVNKFFVVGSLARGTYLYDSFYLTFLLTLKAWLKYIVICFFPWTLSYNHVLAKGISSFDFLDFDKFAVLSQSLFDGHTTAALIVLFSLLILTIRSFQNNRLVSFAIGWFFICLFPVSNLIPNGIYFSEKYLYPALMGFCLLIVYLIKTFKTEKSKVFLYRAIICLLILFIVRNWVRLYDWRNEISLYESTRKTNPYSALTRNDLGLLYTQVQRREDAIKVFEEALQLRDNDPVTYFSIADTYTEMGKYKKAVDALETAIKFKPDYAEAYYNLAGLYAHLGYMNEAKENLDQAVYFYKQRGESDQAYEMEQAFLEYWYNNNRE